MKRVVVFLITKLLIVGHTQTRLTPRNTSFACLSSTPGPQWIHLPLHASSHLLGSPSHSPCCRMYTRLVFSQNHPSQSIQLPAEKRPDVGSGADPIHQLQRHQQTILFQLRTDWLLPTLPQISHTGECPRETGPHTVEHILRFCPAHHAFQRQTWPQGAELKEKL